MDLQDRLATAIEEPLAKLNRPRTRRWARWALATVTALAFGIGAGLAPRLLADRPSDGPSDLAEVPPSWVAVDSMEHSRYGHTATVLNDSRVLVVGGIEEAGHTAEVYDAAADEWTDVPSPRLPRSSHTATTLPDGRVLVVGGCCGKSLEAAEIFDPQTNRWEQAASLTNGRQDHVAAALPDGRILVAGGFSDDGTALASTEIYDAEEGRWSVAKDLRTPRGMAAASVLADGRILISGGSSTEWRINSAEIYDPAKGTWSKTARMLQPAARHDSTLLPDGRVLLTGEACCAEPVHQIYNPATDRWEFASPPLAPVTESATIVVGGTVHVLGGITEEEWDGNVQVYDIEDNRWSVGQTMPVTRQDPVVVELADGSLLLIGGGTDAVDHYVRPE